MMSYFIHEIIIFRKYKIIFTMNENINAFINRNGHIDKFELNGFLTINVNDSNLSNAQIKLNSKPNSKFAIQVIFVIFLSLIDSSKYK